MAPIPVPRVAQELPGLDYEGELVVVMGQEARDVPVEKALDYVLGYSVGNDVSHRGWQFERGGGMPLLLLQSCLDHLPFAEDSWVRDFSLTFAGGRSVGSG